MQTISIQKLSNERSFARFGFLVGLIAVAAVARLLPHPPNFTPMGAIALFGAATFASRRLAVAVPLIAMLASDWLIGFHPLMAVVYTCFILNVALGFWLRKNNGMISIATATLAGSLGFFLVTNFAHWAMFYEHSFTGLVTCFTLAIPFFGNTLAGDVLFSAIMFGTLAISSTRIPALRLASAAS